MSEKPKKLNAASIVVLVIGLLVIGVAVRSFGGSSSSDAGTGSETLRELPTSVEAANAFNPSDLQVTFVVTNDSGSSLAPDCTIEASDPSSSYTGTYMATQDPIASGVSQRLIASVPISDHGASFITDVKAKCTVLTSDTNTVKGKTISVSKVSECGGNDGSTWYWAPCFTVDAAPKTLMTCTATALDSSGKQVATMTDQFNTLNDGVATGYGENAGTRDISKSVYQSIKTVKVSCHL
jgi:hypothetical protein